MTLFGKKGIDTSYERDLFERKVTLAYPEKDNSVWLPSNITEEVQRAREFSVSNVISGYEDLLERIVRAINFIEKEKGSDPNFSLFIKSIDTTGYSKETIKIENDNSDIRSDIQYEIYSIARRLEKSISNQIDFQYDNYASQFIEGRSLEDLKLAENNSISVLAANQALLYTDAHHSHDEEASSAELYDEEILATEIRTASLMHITNGDISFSHLNRQADLEIIVERMETLLYYSNELIEGNMEHMIHTVFGFKDKEHLKTQLLIKFNDTRKKHENSKKKYAPVSTAVESYGSEVAFLQKQIKEKSTETTTQWLYEVEPEVSESLDGLGDLLVKGIRLSEKQYEQSNGSMTQLYKSECDYFASQLDFIQDKEKNRRYFSIIEDLEDKSSLDSEWVNDYLTSNGYKTSAEV